MPHAISYANAWIARVDGAHRRLAGWAVLVIGIAALLLSILGGGALYRALTSVQGGGPILDRTLLYLCVIGPLYAAAAAGLAYERRARQRANASAPVALGVGFALGLGGILLAIALAAALGAVAPGGSAAPFAHRVMGLVIGALLIGLQAFGEELFFRGWMQPVLAARWGPWIGLLATSLLFGVSHSLGQPAGGLAILNDALAGLVFGLLAMRSGGLIAPFAAHFAWNWAEQSLLGLTPNPGIDPLGSLFDLDLIGPALLSGGRDELNGAVTASLALLLMAAATLAWRPAR